MMMVQGLSLPTGAGDVQQWGQLYGSSLSYTICTAAAQAQGMVLVLAPDTQRANRLQQECQFFASSELPILHLPDWETLPYDSFSPHQDIISQRLATLYQLPLCQRGIIIVPISTLMHRLPPVDYVTANSFVLKIGQTLDPQKIRRQLEQRGYYAVSQVMQPGEFALRGSIFDLFPMGSEHPFRIDRLDDEVDSIRVFDPQSQRTTAKIEEIRLLPAREYPLHEAAISQFRQQWRDCFPGNPSESEVYQNISEGLPSHGVEYYLPLFFSEMATLFDYIPSQSLLINTAGCHGAAEQFWHEVTQRQQQCALDHRRPLLAAEKLFLQTNELFHRCKQYPQIKCQTETGHGFNLDFSAPPTLAINHKLKQPLHNLEQYLSQWPHRVLFCAESAGRREALVELLMKYGIKPILCDSWHQFLQQDHRLGIVTGPLQQGFVDQQQQISVITETQLFGEHVFKARRQRTQQQDADAIVRNLAELSPGAAVVHLDHGIGRFVGLQRLTTGDIDAEYLTIEYANQDKLYVPVSSLHLISRYSGLDQDHAPLHQLGSSKWDKAKRKATEKARDVAAELLDVYARRAAREGICFTHPKEQYLSFADSFGFEETIDQENAIQDVINDMSAKQPMDRLICGDVGFGKTEVAIRAAFIAVHNNKQVAMLVPTTLLAQQHYETFCDRFADWPVNIEVLSRFKTKKEQTDIVSQLNQGHIDILIGTHKLLQSDVKFNRLGLLIIDEEHRFGVQQKEKLKAMRSEVDILTLTATPIPRTLNMSIAGMRDLSIIATPPAKRLSIKTFVLERNDGIIREAIMRELLRGGQVYVVHNKVSSIERIAADLAELVPEARIGIGHGQMSERQLEQVMSDFYHQRFNVLVCTTIIETGIDVPSANTMIINRADHFGLAQLHQLRGRVGRSHHQAYAYLMVENKKAITKDAAKRLEAISLLEDLGVGFTLATHDLEIRGAGELLGEEQSGNIQAIGFSLYSDLLERAVKALKAGETLDMNKPLDHGTEIDLKLAALIPEDYLPDVHERLLLYKRIANSNTEEQLGDLQAEMVDRFGPLPLASKQLFAITHMKLLAAPLGIQKIDGGNQGGRLMFRQNASVDPKIIFNLIQQKANTYKMSGPTILKFKYASEKPQERLSFVQNLLQTLGAQSSIQ